MVVPPDAPTKVMVPAGSVLETVRVSFAPKVPEAGSEPPAGGIVMPSRLPCAKAGAAIKKRRTKEIRQVEKQVEKVGR